MSLYIKTRAEVPAPRAFARKLADIPNGVTVSAADLTQGILYEGTPVGKDSDGLYHVVKVAAIAIAAAAKATVYTVAKGHNLSVGDIVFLAKGGAAYAVTAVADNADDSTLDDITVGTTLGAAAVGDCLYEASEAGADAGDFKYAPVALVGESYPVDGTNLIANAWVIATVREALIPAVGDLVKDALRTIVFI